MKFTRTHDMGIINAILSHPTVLPHINDTDKWDLVCDIPQLHFMLVQDDEDEVLGMFMLIPHNRITAEVHSAFLPSAYGGHTKEAASNLLEYVFNTMDCHKLITEVPALNTLAKAFAQRNGLKLEGTLKEAYMYKNTLCDLLIYGITKEEWICQH